MLLRSPVLALLIGAACPGAALGQSDEPVAVVARAHDRAGRLLAGVEVVMNRREVRAKSDSAGLVKFTILPSDSTVGFRRIGYRPLLLTVRPLPPSGDTVLVEMIPSAVELPEVIVSAPPTKPVRYAGTSKYDDVFLRKKLGLGTFLMREDLDRKFVMSTPELLQGIPGVRVAVGAPGARGQTAIRIARCPVGSAVGVFIDGARLIPSRGDPDGPLWRC